MDKLKTKIQSRMRDLHKAMIALHEEGNTLAFNEKNIEWNTLDWVLQMIENSENQESISSTVLRAEQYDVPYSGPKNQNQ